VRRGRPEGRNNESKTKGGEDREETDAILLAWGQTRGGRAARRARTWRGRRANESKGGGGTTCDENNRADLEESLWLGVRWGTAG